MNQSRPVLATVAAMAGVSTPTVSKVVNGHADVSEKTRAKVQLALDKLGYQSPMQRRAKLAGPLLVEFVTQSIDSHYLAEVLTGALDYAASQDVEVVISAMPAEQLSLRDYDEWAQRMFDLGRTGLLLVTSEVTQDLLDAFARRKMPVVVVDPWNPPPSGFVSVGATNWAGGKAATEYLLGLGHRKIAFLGGDPSAECSIARLHGYLAALAGADIEVRPDYVVKGAFNREFGLQATQQLMALEEPPTAIFASSDTVALGVLDEARRRNLKVPEDLSVIGFDGTSLAQPLKEMGRVALRSILQLSRGEVLDARNVEVATQLVVRDSTASPRN